MFKKLILVLAVLAAGFVHATDYDIYVEAQVNEPQFIMQVVDGSTDTVSFHIMSDGTPITATNYEAIMYIDSTDSFGSKRVKTITGTTATSVATFDMDGAGIYGGVNKWYVQVEMGTTYKIKGVLQIDASPRANSGEPSAIMVMAGLPLATDLPVADGGTGLGSGTSGGVLAYTATGTLASSGLLTQYGPVIGGGAGVAPSAIVAGGANEVLCGAAGAAPTMRALVDADIPDNITATNAFETINSLITYLSDGLLIDGTLTISATADQYKTVSTAVYTISGVTYTKAATDNLEFTLADTINTGSAATAYWGIWLVQINAAGTVSTKAGGGLADQLYASEALAIAALPAVDASNAALGYIVVASTVSTPFTCNTTDLTTIGTFSDTQVKALPSAL